MKQYDAMMMSNTSSSTTTTAKTTEQENEALPRSFCMEIFQKGRFSLADEILTPDFVLHNPVLHLELTNGGPEGVKRFASFVAECAPEYHVVHDDTITTDGKIAELWQQFNVGNWL